MTARCRPHLLFAAVVCLLPACISIAAKPVPIAPHDQIAKIAETDKALAVEPVPKTGSDFKVFPSRPGDTVPTKPIKDGTTAKKPPTTNPEPPLPPAGVTTAGDPPSTFPLAPGRPIVTPEAALVAALRAHVEGRPERAIEHIAALDKPNQEFILVLLPALARMASVDLVADPAGNAVIVEQLRAAATRLEARSALVLDHVGFCRNVSRFGSYMPRPPGHPYKSNEMAELYLEVRNLGTMSAVGPNGETHLTSARVAVEVRDAAGRAVEMPDSLDGRNRVSVVRYEKKLYTRGPIHDFHVLHTFPVPPAPGVYTVVVEIRDTTGRRAVKTAPVRFDVSGP